MSDVKVIRLLKLLSLLQTGRPNVEMLSSACNVHRRTVFRDLDMLRRSGFVIHFDQEQGRYSIVNNVVLPETQFTVEEAIAVITLCFETGDEIHVPFLQAARSAAIKLQGMLPERIAEQVGRQGSTMQILPEPVNPLREYRTIFDTIAAAQQNRLAVRISYKSPIEPEFRTLLHPYQLIFCRRSWYVIARSTLHREVRTFHIGRITQLETTDIEYQVPYGFTLRKYFRNAWCIIPEPGPDQEVTIRFSPLVGQNVSEVYWHRTQRTVRNPDGTVDFHVTVSGLHEISWWILGYGKEAEALGPPALRDIIRRHVAELAKKYT